MPVKVLLVTPPFTQLNTPYPATAYLKGFLDDKGIDTSQCDLSIELFNSIFTKRFIEEIFEIVSSHEEVAIPEVWDQQQDYIDKVEQVIGYLHQPEVTAAYQILREGYLPKAHRHEQLHEEDLEYAFGNLGILDKAKHLATIFIEELGDFIKANVDEFFSFTKYAEQISSSASSFDELDHLLQHERNIIEEQLIKLLENRLEAVKPDLVCFTIPFPGNLFAALRCGQYIKESLPSVKVAFGGGYCNTELRSLSDPRVFQYVDFLSLDNGEGPLLKIIEYLDGTAENEDLERTFHLQNDQVVYQNRQPNTIRHHRSLPAPSYVGLLDQPYLSFLDVMNPMHRLWSDGQWNKLTVSHGCYWMQCSFCDVTLDYIGNYQNTTAQDLVNKIEKLVAETGITGFHFVDEAAPPKMLKALAQELLDREVYITWWTNIRFEKTFTPELCELLAASGCIAVTGGLEVASDRLLAKMKKGVDIKQVARVTQAFTDNNIMVHAYLMYGFPTQTDQETVDSLEIVRQLFEQGCIQSAFWHLFSCTAHSPVGKDPEGFGINILGPEFKGFAQNDLIHEDPDGTNHEAYSKGLKMALNNFMNGVGFEVDLQQWFDFEVPKTTHSPDLIASYLSGLEV